MSVDMITWIGLVDPYSAPVSTALAERAGGPHCAHISTRCRNVFAVELWLYYEDFVGVVANSPPLDLDRG